MSTSTVGPLPEHLVFYVGVTEHAAFVREIAGVGRGARSWIDLAGLGVIRFLHHQVLDSPAFPAQDRAS